VLLGKPTEDAEGVATHEKQVDDLVGQGARHEKLAQEDQRGNGGPHGGLQRWVGRDGGWEASPKRVSCEEGRFGITGRPGFPWGAKERVISPFYETCGITR